MPQRTDLTYDERVIAAKALLLRGEGLSLKEISGKLRMDLTVLRALIRRYNEHLKGLRGFQ